MSATDLDLLAMKNSAVVFACPPETTVAEACLTLRDRRVTSALIGASRPAQILENVKAAERADFAEEELSALDEVLA